MQTKSYISDVKSLLLSWFESCAAQYTVRQRILKPIDIFILISSLTPSNGYESIIALNRTLPDVAKSSVSKYRQKLHWTVFYSLYSSAFELSKKYIDFPKQCIYAIDGSKYPINNQLIKEGYKHFATDLYPMGQINSTIEVTTGLITDLELTPDLAERPYVINQLDKFKEGDIVLMDRGYYSFDLANCFITKKVHPVFRMREELLPIIEFKSKKAVDQIKEIRKGTATIKLRVVKYSISTQDYYLATTLMDCSIDRLKELYHMRWDIEESYKVLKQTAGFYKPHARSENGIRQELYVHMFNILVSKTIQLINLQMLRPSKEDTESEKNTNSDTGLKKIQKIHKRSLNGRFDYKNKRTRFNGVVCFQLVVSHMKELIKEIIKPNEMTKAIVKYLERHKLSYKLNRSYLRVTKFPFGNKTKYQYKPKTQK